MKLGLGMESADSKVQKRFNDASRMERDWSKKKAKTIQ